MEYLRFRLTGVKPLLLHNVRLSNPLDRHAKAVSEVAKKRSKTEADHLALSKLEFVGGSYHDDEIGPYVPGTWIDKTLEEGGRGEKLGKSIRATVRCVDEMVAIQYRGPRKLEQLWDKGYFDRRPVGVGQSKTLRTRPKFEEWVIEPVIAFESHVVNESAIIRALERAGVMVGLGDYRPRFGLFTVERLASDA